MDAKVEQCRVLPASRDLPPNPTHGVASKRLNTDSAQRDSILFYSSQSPPYDVFQLLYILMTTVCLLEKERRRTAYQMLVLSPV